MNEPMTLHACPPRCDAGGRTEDLGHVFDQEEVLEWHEEKWSALHQRILPRRPALVSMVCRCGFSAFDLSMWRGE